MALALLSKPPTTAGLQRDARAPLAVTYNGTRNYCVRSARNRMNCAEPEGEFAS